MEGITMKKLFALSCLTALLLAGCAESSRESEGKAGEVMTYAAVTTAAAETTAAATTAAASEPATEAPHVPMTELIAEGAGDFISGIYPVVLGDADKPYVTANVFDTEQDSDSNATGYLLVDALYSCSEGGAELVTKGRLHVIGEHEGTFFYTGYHAGEYGFIRFGNAEPLDIPRSGKLDMPLCVGDSVYMRYDGYTGTDVYRIDYLGAAEKLCTLPEINKLTDWCTEGDRIYFSSYDWELPKSTAYKYGWYDMATGECKTFPDGGVGEICGEYMYYSEEFADSRGVEHGIFRVPKNGGEPEYICDGEYLLGIFGGDVLYTAGHTYSDLSYALQSTDKLGRIYRIGHGSDGVFFDADEYYGAGKNFVLTSTQVLDGRLFVRLTDSDMGVHILELDTDGNVINTVFEYEPSTEVKSTNRVPKV